MRWLALLVLLLPTWAGAQLTLPYDVPNSGGGTQTICPNASYPGCAGGGLAENDTTLLGGIVALDGDNDGVADEAAALETNPAACGAGEFVQDLDADGTLSCTVPAGGGNMLSGGPGTGTLTGYDVGENGVVDNSESLACSTCVSTGELEFEAIDLTVIAGTAYVESGGVGVTLSGADNNKTANLDTCAAHEVLKRDAAGTNVECESIPHGPYAFYTADLSTYDTRDGTQCYYVDRDITITEVVFYTATGSPNATNIIHHDGARTAASSSCVLAGNPWACCSGAGAGTCDTQVCTADISGVSAGTKCTTGSTLAVTQADADDWFCFKVEEASPTAVVSGATLTATIR